MNKIIWHNIYEERHELTKQLRLDMLEMNTAHSLSMIHFFEGRMLGLVAAYERLGIIDIQARATYIQIIETASWKRAKEYMNEV